MKQIQAWRMLEVAKPMEVQTMDTPELGAEEVLVRIVGCGVCHTDLGFFYDGVRTVQPLPLTLGHEISGFVEETGTKKAFLKGKAVLIPAVLPCGECDLCQKGQERICRQQKMPGNDIDGGFASHVVVPAKYLCEVAVEKESDLFGESGITLKELSVVADAVTTPYQAIQNAGLAKGDLAIFIGIGGIGGFGVQIAKALGATVVAIDIDERKLEKFTSFGADATFNPKEMDKKQIRKAIQKFAAERSLSPYEWKIFETSGSRPGQELAFGLLTFGATLAVVGYTMDTVELRLSNLMAYDAKAIGNWGCRPQYYPEVLQLVQQGKIQLSPFVQTFNLSEINKVFTQVHQHEIEKRPVLVPDFA